MSGGQRQPQGAFDGYTPSTSLLSYGISLGMGLTTIDGGAPMPGHDPWEEDMVVGSTDSFCAVHELAGRGAIAHPAGQEGDADLAWVLTGTTSTVVLSEDMGDLPADLPVGRSRSLESGTPTVTSMKSTPTSRRQGRKLAEVARASVERNFELSKEVASLVTFEGCKHLLRGSRASSVLAGRGFIFKGSGGNARTFAMSQEVDMIDTFISHNWVTPRNKKFWALAFYFNFNFAALVSMVATTLLGFIFASGHGKSFVTYSAKGGDGMASWPQGVECRCICAPIFFLMLAYGHSIQAGFGCRGSVVFLDKTCINQTDLEMQRQGIAKLSAFLCYSKEMVVLYSDVYLTKLWTVYEVASFLALHPTDRMITVPTFLSVVALAAIFLGYLGTIVGIFLMMRYGFDYGSQTSIMLLSYVFPFILRIWFRDKHKIRDKLRNFTVHSCECFCEEDRPVVHRNIAALMRETNTVDNWASDVEALLEFDKLVQRDLPDAFDMQLGPHALWYKHWVAVVALSRGPVLLDTLAGVPLGLPLRNVAANAIYLFTWIFGLYPLAFAFQAYLASHQMRLRGCWEFLYLVGVNTLFQVPLALVLGVSLVLKKRSEECHMQSIIDSTTVGCRPEDHDFYMMLSGIYALLTFIASYLTFSGRVRRLYEWFFKRTTGRDVAWVSRSYSADVVDDLEEPSPHRSQARRLHSTITLSEVEMPRR